MAVLAGLGLGVSDAIGADGEDFQCSIVIAGGGDADGLRDCAGEVIPPAPTGAVGRGLPVVVEVAGVAHHEYLLLAIRIIGNRDVIVLRPTAAQAGPSGPTSVGS